MGVAGASDAVVRGTILGAGGDHLFFCAPREINPCPASRQRARVGCTGPRPERDSDGCSSSGHPGRCPVADMVLPRWL
eukprot:1846717-Alexandrium_andersonii.AAC.1